MRIARTLALATMTLLLASCGSDGGQPAATSAAASSTQAPSAAASSTQAPSAVVPSAGATPSATISPSRSARPILVLMADGLGLQAPDSTTITKLLFGKATAAQVDAALTATLGAPKRETITECGQGARISSFSHRFTALYDGTTFLGWTDQGAPGHLTSTAGIGIGSTLAEVKAVQADVQTTEDSLGPEFFVEGGISGMLDGLKPTSKVTLVYAGETCFFR